MAKKNNEGELSTACLYEEIDALQAKNAALELDNGDLQEQSNRFMKQAVEALEKCDKEHEYRREVQRENEELKDRVFRLSAQLDATKALRDTERRKRHGSIPKFVIVAAVALLVLMTSFSLQKLSLIGPAVGFGIQCGSAMVIAWCYAIIWDRSRK